MPFFLYALDSQRGEYRQVREVSLSGKASPFRTVSAEAGQEWHASEERILSLLGVERPDEHRILIDLKPGDKSTVSLYRLRDVWGYSYKDWTPLALRLESLLVDEPQDNPSTFKQVFCGPLRTKDFIYEFLYLNGGTKSGKWTWGLVGRVNGTLLWPDALRYFLKAINRQLVGENLEPFCQ
jgi:hypothetical protein